MSRGSIELLEDENRRLKLEVTHLHKEVTHLHEELSQRDALVAALEAQIKVLIKGTANGTAGLLPPPSVATPPSSSFGAAGRLPPRGPTGRSWMAANRGRMLSRILSDEDDESTRPLMPTGNRRLSRLDPPRRMMEEETSDDFTTTTTQAEHRESEDTSVLALNGSVVGESGIGTNFAESIDDEEDDDVSDDHAVSSDYGDETVAEIPTKTGLKKVQGAIKALPNELSIRNAEDDDVTKYSVDDTNMPTYQVEASEMRDAYSARGLYTGSVSRKQQVPHGKGLMNYHLRGRSYDGEWVMGHWHGYGKLRYPNGDIYEGHLDNDLRIGHGVLYYHDGRVFSGHFQDDDPVMGTLTFPDGAQYCGELHNQARHGFGTYYFSDGSTYEGMSSMNVFQGHGKMTWPDGGWYEGEWLAGEISGQGKEIRADGSLRHEGQWSNGVPIRRN